MRREKTKNRRQETAVFLILAVSLLTAVTIAGIFLKDAAMETDFSSKNLAPSMSHLFGTDWMGRDMFARTLAGLSLSIRIGLLTACVSAGIALLMGTGAAVLGRRVDACISWWIDLMMGIPHILLVILISLACGKGFLGVAAGVSLSHWPSLSRVIRGEVLQLRQAPYVLAAGKLGAGKFQVAGRHMLPHVLPQFLTGLILLFPHAILHESSVTFLGFRTFGRAAGHRRDPVGEHAVPDHGEMVAGPLSRDLAGADCGIVRPTGRAGKAASGPGQCA